MPKNDWCKALERAMSARLEPPPKGWITAEEVAGEMNYSNDYIRAILPKMIAARAIEKKQFRIKTKGGYFRFIPHYRLK